MVPPLSNRLDQQNLADMRTSVKDETSPPSQFVGYTPTGQTFISTGSKNFLQEAVRLLGLQLSARVVVFTNTLKPVTSTAGLDPFNVRAYPMLSKAVRYRHSSTMLPPAGCA